MGVQVCGVYVPELVQHVVVGLGAKGIRVCHRHGVAPADPGPHQLSDHQQGMVV